MAKKDNDEELVETAEQTPPPQIFAQWDFPEHERHERSIRWFFISGVLIVALLIFAYFDQNPLLAVIVILGLVAFIVGELRGPDFHSFAITEDGVVVGNVFYKYENIKNFYIIYKPPEVKMLYIEPTAFIQPRIGIPLHDQNPVEIRDVLLNFLEEDLEKEDEPVSDLLGRIFKF